MVGTGVGARRGILIKNGEALERGSKIDVVMLDKTGTLTEGRPKVTEVIALAPEIAPDKVLRLAASLERLSEHPLGQAIVRAAQEKNLTTESVEDFANVAGLGVKGRMENAAVLVGNVRFMREEGVGLGAALAQIEARQARAETVVVVARNGNPIGLIAIADTLKSDAKEAIAQLRARRHHSRDDHRRQPKGRGGHRARTQYRAILRRSSPARQGAPRSASSEGRQACRLRRRRHQ